MLNIKGAFVFIGPNGPLPFILSESALNLFEDRIRVVGIDKAIDYGFKGYTHALPCTLACMEFIALNYVGPYQIEVRTMCACIALGKPLGGDGGAKADLSPPKPRKPRGGGHAVALPSQMATAS